MVRHELEVERLRVRLLLLEVVSAVDRMHLDEGRMMTRLRRLLSHDSAVPRLPRGVVVLHRVEAPAPNVTVLKHRVVPADERPAADARVPLRHRARGLLALADLAALR